MNQDKLPFSTVYIELDCLFDTRLSTLYTFGDEAVLKVLDKGYLDRTTDVFSGIDKLDYQDRYQKRTKAILENTMLTPMGRMLVSFTQSTIHQTSTTPFHFRPKIIVNIHPYVLTEAECNVVIQGLATITQKQCDIEIVSHTLEDLTPRYVKRNISILVLYEYYQWIEFHCANENFKKITCPEVSLFGPQLYFKGPPSAADLQLAEKEKLTPFQAMELAASPFISLHLLPIDQFSIALKR